MVLKTLHTFSISQPYERHNYVTVIPDVAGKAVHREVLFLTYPNYNTNI